MRQQLLTDRDGIPMTVGAYVPAGVAARLLGLTRRTIVRWVQTGQLAGRRECARCADGDAGCRGCRWYVYRVALLSRLAEAR